MRQSTLHACKKVVIIENFTELKNELDEIAKKVLLKIKKKINNNNTNNKMEKSSSQSSSSSSSSTITPSQTIPPLTPLSMIKKNNNLLNVQIIFLMN